jgi:Retrotransposon gag protein
MSSPTASSSEERKAREREEFQEMRERIAELEQEKQEQAERFLELSKRKAIELEPSTDVEEEGTNREPPLRRPRSGDLVKPPKPPTFEGIGRMNVDLWIFEVEQYFQVVRIPRDEQVGWAGALLRDAAATWWRSVVIEAQQANHETEPDSPEPKPASQLFTWGKFKELIRTRFVPIEASKTARMRLLTLKQLKFGGIEGYNNEFQKLLSLIVDMNLADQINYYVMGLKPEVARDVNLASPKTLLEAMGLASRSSDSLAQHFAAANRFSSSRFRSTSSNSYPAATSGSTSGMNSTEPPSHSSSSAVSTIQSTSRADHEYTNTPLSDIDRGEVNFINRNDGFRPTSYLLNRDEWDRLKREKKCFRCKRMGHLAHECRRFPSQTRGPYRGYNSRPYQPSLNSQARRF